MYSNIFTDVEVESRRMKKQLSDVDVSGPTQRDLEQMAEREIQMAAYLATNPDPVTGLPRRQAQEMSRDPRDRDQQMFSRYDDQQVRYDYDERLFQGTGTMTASQYRDLELNPFIWAADAMSDRIRSRHGSGDSEWVIRTNHGTR